MPLLVDGDNLLGTWSGRKRSNAERHRLATELPRQVGGRKKLVVVFDGTPAPGLHFGAHVRFSGAGRKGDEVILELLRAQQDRRGWIVVTSDRSLGDQCRWLGARVERCDLFRRRLRDHVSAEKPDHEEDVAFWLEEFGEGPDE